MTLPVREELKSLTAIALPLVLAQLAHVGMGFVDTLMVGRLGPEPLAGIALGALLFFFFQIVALGVLAAVTPLVAQAFGSRDTGGAARAARQGLWLATALGLPGFVLLRSSSAVLLAMGQEPAVVAQSAAYLEAVAWGFWPALLFGALRSFFEGVGDTRPIMTIMAFGVVLNVVANDALMFGRWGLPALGLAGTGYATTLVFVLMTVAAVGFLRWRHRRFRVLAGLHRPDLATLRELLRVGWPLSLSRAFESGLFAVTGLLMGLFGQAQLAGHQIAIQSASMAFMVPLGISIATSVRVGHAVGRSDAAGVRRAGAIGIGLSAVTMAGTALLFWLAPRLVIGLYLDPGAAANAEVVRFAASFLAFAAAFQIFDGLQVSAAGALTGLKDTRVPMVLALVAYWLVGVPVAVLFAFVVGLEGRGLWLGLTIGLATAAVLLLLRFGRGSSVSVVAVLDRVSPADPIR